MSAFLTVREVAELTKLHEMTIRRYIRAGKLEAVRIGRRIRIPRQAVARLVAPAQPVEAAPEMALREPAVAYETRPRPRPPVLLPALSEQLARLDEGDLAQVADLVRRLHEEQEERLRREKAERKALARKIVEESKLMTGSLAHLSRDEIFAQFMNTIEEIRQDAIARGYAIEGEWIGD